MRRALPLLGLVVLTACDVPPQAGEAPAQDMLTAVVDLSDQQVVVTRTRAADGSTETYRSPVSTGTTGYATPTGTFRPFFMSKNHKSSLYDDAPMPWSVFFNRDVAIHGTYAQTALGQPASHGCVRVHPVVAEMFYKQVLEVGKANTTVSVVE